MFLWLFFGSVGGVLVGLMGGSGWGQEWDGNWVRMEKWQLLRKLVFFSTMLVDDF